MYKCDQCPSIFNMKRNLVRHLKTHSGVRFSCNVCPSSFSYSHSLVRHTNKFHPVVNVPAQPAVPIAEQNVINLTPSIFQPTTEGYIQIASQIFVPDVPAGCSNIISNDDLCMAAIDELENQDLADTVDERKEKWRKLKDTSMKSKKEIRTGSESVINKPWPLANLDKVNFERSTITNVSPFIPSVNEMLAEDDEIDENEDKRPNFETNVSSTKNDDVDLFFRNIAETVKKFSKKSVSKAKLKVLMLVLELEDKYDGLGISGSAFNPAYSPQDNPPNSNSFTTYNYDAYTQVPEP